MASATTVSRHHCVCACGLGLQSSEYYFKKCPKKSAKQFSDRHAWDLELECLALLKEKNHITML